MAKWVQAVEKKKGKDDENEEVGELGLAESILKNKQSNDDDEKSKEISEEEKKNI